LVCSCNTQPKKKYLTDQFRLTIESGGLYGFTKILLNNDYYLDPIYYPFSDPKPTKSHLYIITGENNFDKKKSFSTDTICIKLTSQQIDSIYNLTFDFLSKYRADRYEVGNDTLSTDSPRAKVTLMCNHKTNIAIIEYPGMASNITKEYKALIAYVDVIKIKHQKK